MRGLAVTGAARSAQVPDVPTMSESGFAGHEADTLQALLVPAGTSPAIVKRLHTFGVDRRGIHRGIEGLCVDSAGNVIACAGWQRSGSGPLVYVFSPAGAMLETHVIPADLPLSCAFL